MRAPLSIAVAQPPCVSNHVEANAEAHAATVAAASARVVVFPELSLTGYELDAPAITADDPRLASIKEACARSGSVALVGAPVLGDAGAAHIATLAVDGTAARVAYCKMWLGQAEAIRFTPGDKPSVIEVDGTRLGLAICKDINTPRHAIDTVAVGIDVYVASVLDTVQDTTRQAARIRQIAMEQGICVAVASFAGSTGGGFDHAAGRSSISSPDGTVVARAGREPGAIARASL